MLNAKQYFQTILQENRLARTHDFHFTTYTGTREIEGILSQHRQHAAIFALSDLTESRTYQAPGGAWYNRRILSAFILKRYKAQDTTDQAQQLNTCRELLRQIHSRLLIEQIQSNTTARMDTERIDYRELGAHFLDSTTGIHFQIALDEPIELCYNPDQWDNTTAPNI